MAVFHAWTCSTFTKQAGFAPDLTHLDAFMALEGIVHRAVKDRQTHQLLLNGQSIFIKKHFGVGWLEIFKNLLSLKRPVLGARNEWIAIQRLTQLGIATTPWLAFGERGCSPASRRSFIVTQDLGDIVTLEALCANWQQTPPQVAFKRGLIRRVATLARQFHANGMVHRDFYLCHFALQRSASLATDAPLILMDLHRVEIHAQLPDHKRMKDLAGLYFSALHIGLTKRDIYRFLITYFQASLRQILQTIDYLDILNHRAMTLDLKLKRKLNAGVRL